jgi:(2R)-ethylmalonyl-CoA mutase
MASEGRERAAGAAPREKAEKGGAPRRKRDRPWIFRTYAGHSTAAESNRLFRANLAKGQTGLSVAFDLPTQVALDSDHPLARGEVGKVGVPVCHLGDMRTLFKGIPLERMNTSMTINAPAAWLLALYVALAEEQGADRRRLAGTTQNDIVKEYLSRGTYIFPPGPSLMLTRQVITWCQREMPRWNPTNVCSYHLQEAGARPEQELAYALANAVNVLDMVRDSGEVAEEDFPLVVGRISFFVNAGMRFITEMCKMRAFTELWDEICRERYGVEDPRLRRFRYGVQVNSLGLTEAQPENNIHRILIEMLAVVLSKRARARAVQLPAWNEALGLPRPWDQQWSLRMQQIMAFETDLLEYEDIFDGSPVIAARVEELKAAARAEMKRIEEQGGLLAALESGWIKARLVAANAERMAAIEAGEITVVGVNAYTESEPSPLAAGDEEAILKVSEHVESEQIARLQAWRRQRDERAAQAALAAFREAACEGRNIMEPSIACARAGVTTGEWGQVLREVFGEYRAPTGVSAAPVKGERMERLIRRVRAWRERHGRAPRLLIGKPGLDGHSNGAEQIAARARAAGFDARYDGIRFTPAEIVDQAREHGADVIGLSILSGSHVPLVQEIMRLKDAAGLRDVPVVVGGIIPREDRLVLKQCGVKLIYTPSDYRISDILEEILELLEQQQEEAPAQA